MKLLIIGSLDGQIGAASKIALDRGAKVDHAGTIDDAMDALRTGRGAELIMADVKLDIAALIQRLRDEHINVPVVACGVNPDTEAAVRAIRAGAKEFVPLPPDADLIAAVLEAVTEENNALIYCDPAMQETLRLAEQIAPSNASVLVTGASGTGKELLARFLHRKSRRSKKKFVSVNCAAIPENLLESELFGHEKGAFTGAIARRIGKFEEANGGTLLLDEISEMAPHLQAKLLRAIQEKEIDRVGGNQPIRLDIRLIATSNRNLEDEVRKGTFREDLYFRLNVVNLEIPPLCKRPKDIWTLAEHFAEKYADLNDVPRRAISQKAHDLLLAHSWPGNVRELENAIHRAVLISRENEIEPAAFSLNSRHSEASGDALKAATETLDDDQAGTTHLVGRTVADVERDLILDTLHHCFGNRTRTAGILGISIRTLRNKLKQYSAEGVAVPIPGSLGSMTI
ncbi:MAG: sigma-54-dependent Fis family transcriptional regulator [Rhodospirillaceae bacterium]|nr:MAG: sigma-54-dependent Fis family transcriptional regulator [Rhodospirillaceae bacterium]